MKVGDIIQCRDADELIECMDNLMKVGIYTGFIYEKDGEPGFWLVVEKVIE